jgi:hypothetical protein
MGFRFFRRKTLFPGVTLNMSKSGPSISFGPRGFKHTIGGRGRRTTVGLPGTGLHYTVEHNKNNKNVDAERDGTPTQPELEPKLEYVVDPNTAAERLDRDFLRAVVAFQSKQESQALNVLNGIFEAADARWLAGMIELRSRNWMLAADHLEFALEKETKLGELCERNSISMEIAYAITTEVQAHLGPDPRSTRLALAEAYQGGKKLIDALGILKEMNQYLPEDFVVALSLAEITFEIEGSRKMEMLCLVDILDATKVPEGLAWSYHFARARALERSGALSEAIVSYTRAMSDENIPEDMFKLAWYEKALSFEETGDRTRCRQELSGLYATDKSFADVENRLRNSN